MIESRHADESNTARNQYRRPNLSDACAARWTRRTPICELRPRAILYLASQVDRKQLVLQTVIIAVAAAVIVNLLPRKK